MQCSQSEISKSFVKRRKYYMAGATRFQLWCFVERPERYGTVSASGKNHDINGTVQQDFNYILLTHSIWKGFIIFQRAPRLSDQRKLVPWRLVPRPFVLVTIRLMRSSPMDRHLAPPISGSWSPGAARAVDGASLLHSPLRVDRNAETEKKLNGWTKGQGTKFKGTQLSRSSFRKILFLRRIFHFS